MPIRFWNGRSPRFAPFATRSLRIFAATLVWHVLGCASAKVSNQEPNNDGSSDANGSGSDKDGSTSVKNDGPAGDVVYGSCDPFTNAGCSITQKCTALRTGSTLALGCGSKGDKSQGAACAPVPNETSQTGDDCGTGLACFAVAGESATCHRLCSNSGTANACPGTDTCSIKVGTFSSSTGLAFCQASTTCLPLEQTGCSTGQACYYGQKGAVCAPVPAVPVQPGDTCTNANDCAPGSTCLIIGSSGICSSFCSTASNGSPGCSGAAMGGTICAALGGGTDEPNLGTCRQQP